MVPGYPVHERDLSNRSQALSSKSSRSTAPDPLESSPLILPPRHLIRAAELLVTGSPRKAREYSAFLGGNVETCDRDVREGQLTNQEALEMSRGIYANGAKQVAIDKARKFYTELNRPVIVEDTWFSLDGLGGQPGPFFSLFKYQAGYCQDLAERVHPSTTRAQARSLRATAIISLAYCAGDSMEPIVWQGIVRGVIAPTERGGNGEEWDKIFVATYDDSDVPVYLHDIKNPSLGGKTFAELTSEEQESVSARKRAVDALRNCPIAEELFGS